MKDPEIVSLSSKERDDLLERIKSSNLSNKDQKLLIRIIHFCNWLQYRLSEAKLSIGRLRRLFGFKTEKKNR